MPRLSWSTVTPLLAAVALAIAWPLHPDSAPVLGVLSVLLVAVVLAAVHHAEVVAHRVGEPYGSLVLAVAVTIIEVGLIVTLMVTTDKDTAGLARDTVFAAVMITLNGIVGLARLPRLCHHFASPSRLFVSRTAERRGHISSGGHYVNCDLFRLTPACGHPYSFGR